MTELAYWKRLTWRYRKTLKRIAMFATLSSTHAYLYRRIFDEFSNMEKERANLGTKGLHR